MAKRTGAKKASRVAGASTLPTPVHSSQSTPLSSAYPSTYASEDECEPDSKMIARLSLRNMTLQDFNADKSSSKKALQPFRFMDLPSELRVKVYGYHFDSIGDVIDLDPDNYKSVYKKLAVLRVCRTMYIEASHALFSAHALRIFPTHGRFYKTKKPLLARLVPRQRAQIGSLELRLGPGFNKPPRSWLVNPALGLLDCVSVRSLNIFVECDPSDGYFNGFRRADGFYEEFCGNLLVQVLSQLSGLQHIRFDANPGVKKSGAMMQTLLGIVAAHGRTVLWGPERGWTDADEDDAGASRSTYVAGMSPVGSVGPRVVVVA